MVSFQELKGWKKVGIQHIDCVRDLILSHWKRKQEKMHWSVVQASNIDCAQELQSIDDVDLKSYGQ